MSGKFIGIINFNNTSKEEQNKNIKTLINELVDMDYRVLVVDHDEDYVQVVANIKDIHHWIVHGDDFRLRNKRGNIDMRLFDLDKHFLLCSYAMQNFLEQQDVELSHDRNMYDGEMKLSIADHPLFDGLSKKMNVYRKHKHYVTRTDDEDLIILNETSKEPKQIMTALYKNAPNDVVLLQWDPAKSNDGRIFIHNWIH
jgi:hypothetical protein